MTTNDEIIEQALEILQTTNDGDNLAREAAKPANDGKGPREQEG